jgi:hypothetical protein
MARTSAIGLRERSILTVLLIVLVLGLILFAVAARIATHKSEVVRSRWERSFGSRESILERYPAREANDAARTLERLAAAIGIDLAPRGIEERERPSRESVAGHRRIKVSLGRYLGGQVQRPERRVDSPPAELAGFLDQHGEAIAAIRQQLNENDAPVWERDIEIPYAAPIPNLLGHLDLQRLLLADALASGGRGDDRRALDDLNASWQLNRALRDDPILITQLIAITVTRLQIGTLRQLGQVPPNWVERLAEHNFRQSLLSSLRFEAWAWTQVDHAAMVQPALGQRVVYSLGRPYVRYCLADASEDYRQRLDNLARSRTWCDVDLAALEADLHVPASRWNLLGDLVVPNLSGAVDRLRRLELDIELTAKIIEIETDRRANSGVWPGAVPASERSTVCPDDRWVYEIGPGGEMAIGFSREISWPEQKGIILPTRFAAER